MDLISRQAVIDEIEERVFANRTAIPVVSELNRIEGYVMRLPSAHPEIIRCKDCKWHTASWYCEMWDNTPGFPAVTDDCFCFMAERGEDGSDFETSSN